MSSDNAAGIAGWLIVAIFVVMAVIAIVMGIIAIAFACVGIMFVAGSAAGAYKG